MQRNSPSGARDGEANLGEVSGAVAVDFSATPLQRLTLVGNATLTLTPPAGAQHCQLAVEMGGAGSYTLTPPAGTKVAGGPYTPTTAAGSEDLLTFYWNGALPWRMAASKGFVA